MPSPLLPPPLSLVAAAFLAITLEGAQAQRFNGHTGLTVAQQPNVFPSSGRDRGRGRSFANMKLELELQRSPEDLVAVVEACAPRMEACDLKFDPLDLSFEWFAALKVLKVSERACTCIVAIIRLTLACVHSF